jgi:hypothetical protein
MSRGGRAFIPRRGERGLEPQDMRRAALVLTLPLSLALAAAATAASAPGTSSTTWKPGIPVGSTVLLAEHDSARGCTLGALPDPRCSPGAYYNRLSKKVICGPNFKTGLIRHVTDGEKHQVEQEYGLTPKSYGRTLEIDHIVSLELGGSNDIANLDPEEATFADGSPGYHVKDKLENRLHDMVCAGQISLSTARHQIAADWERLYKKVYGVAPGP